MASNRPCMYAFSKSMFSRKLYKKNPPHKP